MKDQELGDGSGTLENTTGDDLIGYDSAWQVPLPSVTKTFKGNAYGGGFFFVDDATAGTAAIGQSSFNGNSAAFAGGLYFQGATGTLTYSSVINNQVEAIDGVAPYA